MGSKKLIIAMAILSCFSISSLAFMNKNEKVQAKSLQPKVAQANALNNKNILGNSCFVLDKQVEKEWRTLNSESQTTGYLYPAKQDNKWGFIDSRGQYKILPQYDYVTLFSPAGTAICGNYMEDKENTYTSAKLIDKSGNIVLDGIVIAGHAVGYPGSGQPFDNYFEVFNLKNGKNVIVDQTGKVIYSTTEELGPYSEGFVAEGNSAYIDVSKLIDGKSNFKITLHKKYKAIWNFSHKYAALQINDEKTEYVDVNGKIYGKEPKGYTDILDKNDYIADEMHDRFYALDGELSDDGYKIIKKVNNGNTVFGIDWLDGKELLAAKYDGIKYLGEGMFAIGQGGYGYSEYHTNEYELIFDARKIKLYKIHYYMLQRYYDGVAAASDLKRSFFIDREGKKAKGYPVFDKVGQLTRICGLIMHEVHGKVSYYQKNGMEIYLEKDPCTILKEKMGYISISAYRRYDFGLEYPYFFGLTNTSAQKKINDVAKKMNEEVFREITTDDPKLSDYDIFHDELDVTLNGNLLMVKYVVVTNGGGTLCIPYIISKYFDIRTGQSYDLSSMFNSGVEYKKELVKKVIELYDHKKLLALLWLQGDLNELKNFLLDGNFYIDKDGIIISEFPDGSSNHLISYTELKIPYANIMSMINTKSELWNSFEAQQSQK